MENQVLVINANDLEVILKKLLDDIAPKQPKKWITHNEACDMLSLSKKSSTLWLWRSKGLIRYTQISRKLILYDYDSIMEILEKHAKDTF